MNKPNQDRLEIVTIYNAELELSVIIMDWQQFEANLFQLSYGI